MILDCIKEIETRMKLGESFERAKQNVIYLEDLTQSERIKIDSYFNQ